MAKLSIFDQFSYEEPQKTDALAEVLAPKAVPTVFPSVSSLPYRLAIVGEFPGAADLHHGIPFCPTGTPDHPYVGSAGRELNKRLSQSGIVREGVLLSHLTTPTLEEDLKKYVPHLTLLLGKNCLLAAKGEKKLEAWRGSLFVSDVPGPFFGLKCLASFSPWDCLRQYDWIPLLSFDIRKAKLHATESTLTLPHRDLRVGLSVAETIEELTKIKETKPTIAIDIEGYVDAMSCISIAPSPDYSFIVPLATRGNNNYYDSLEDELSVWRLLASVLEDATIPKVLQNSLYDRFVLQYSYQIVVRGVVDDTMLRHWELYCELEKSLGFQASIYTDEPFYKSERKSEDTETFHKYCCRDSAITLEINQKLARYLDPSQDNHYRFNMTLLNPLLYMENRGIKYDVSAAKECLTVVEQHLAVLQSELDSLSGKGWDFSHPDSLARARAIMGFKRDPMTPKKDYEEHYDYVVKNITSQDIEVRAHISEILGATMNIKSADFKTYLYETLNLPKQYIEDPKTKESRLSTSYACLLKLQKAKPTRAVDLAIQIGLLRTRSQMLHISADRDGRVRCGYNIVGTETGRLTCYTSPTGSGYNLQTIPSTDSSKPADHPLHAGMRHLFLADDGCWMFQCDLSGADGWTVAANCANLGDRTMLDDYLAGIKPAKVLCYLLRHGANALAGKTRSEIKSLTKEVNSSDWDYFACKVGQHGSCYLMGARKLAAQIFMLSEGKVNLTEKETKDLQRLFFIRYRVKLWHDWMERQLAKSPTLITSYGYKRRFFGRPNEILGQALAHEPQCQTTYATNLAMYNLWTDPDNRYMVNGRLALRIEPLHQVHDALLGQFKKEDTSWALTKIQQYFNNKVMIANQPIVIPFEGAYGSSWGTLNEGTI